MSRTGAWGVGQATCAAAKRAGHNRWFLQVGVYSENRDEVFLGRGRDSESKGKQTLLTQIFKQI